MVELLCSPCSASHSHSSLGSFFRFLKVLAGFLLLRSSAAGPTSVDICSRSALALCLFLEAQRRGSDGPSGHTWVAGTVAFVLPTLWAGLTLEIDGEAPSRWQVLVLVAIFTVGIALAFRGMRTGLLLLVAMFAVGAATINPLQRGLAPLVDGPSAQLGRTLRARPGTGNVLTFAEGGGLDARAGLIASGVRLVSGVNLYPNKAAWRVLDADGSERHTWDRYNNAVWNAGPPGSEPQITGEGDRVDVVVDPCDARLGKLGVRTVVSTMPLMYACLAETHRAPGEHGTILYVYRSRPDGQAMKYFASGWATMTRRGALLGYEVELLGERDADALDVEELRHLGLVLESGHAGSRTSTTTRGYCWRKTPARVGPSSSTKPHSSRMQRCQSSTSASAISTERPRASSSVSSERTAPGGRSIWGGAPGHPLYRSERKPGASSRQWR